MCGVCVRRCLSWLISPPGRLHGHRSGLPCPGEGSVVSYDEPHVFWGSWLLSSRPVPTWPWEGSWTFWWEGQWVGSRHGPAVGSNLEGHSGLIRSSPSSLAGLNLVRKCQKTGVKNLFLLQTSHPTKAQTLRSEGTLSTPGDCLSSQDGQRCLWSIWRFRHWMRHSGVTTG